MKKYLQIFLGKEIASGFLLLSCTLFALFLANSSFSESYFSLLHFPAFGHSLHAWVNDGLMAIFFFLVGMEIKRELVAGELASPKQAALPIAAAIGGMVVPALIYYAFNPSGLAARGWGIPMATDIAFALGVLSLFGKRVPLPLKIFLLALAIVDDLGAVMVIALFYSGGISGPALAVAVAGLGAMGLCRYLGWSRYLPYVLLGVLVWAAVWRSGIHATVAGVVIGLLTPYRFFSKENTAFSPLEDLIHKLHPWVSFGIMPIFALANAGVDVRGAELNGLVRDSVFVGVFFGLVCGKPLGILVASWIAVQSKVASLPRGVGWGEILGVSALGGVGFTMALFISSLAMAPEQEVFSKMGILLASVVAAVGGAGCLAVAFRFRRQ